MTRLKTECNKMAREAVLQGDRYLGQKDYRGASVFYLKASRLGSKEGNKKYRQMQELLGDSDLVNPEQYAKNQKKSQIVIERPKMAVPLSIPSEDNRMLVEDRSKLQQKTIEQQDKKTAESQRQRKTKTTNADELLKRALESEARGNKREAFQLLKKAVDYGSEIAKAKFGQRYLKLAVRYLGRQAAFEKLEGKITPPRKEDKTDASSGDKLHFRHQRNRIAELNGCGDMAETETSVLHTAKAEGKTWVGNENENNSPQTEFIIQELVRYVTYWWGNDCLPELILINGQKPVTCEFSLQTGHEFCTETIIWQADFADEPSWRHIFTLLFRKLFSIFRK